MEELKRPSHAPEKKEVVLNIGKVSAHGGGGIGGVILLGGALATAAFASAFIIGKKRQGGSRDNSSQNTHIPSPPPPLATVNKDGLENEANKKEQFTFLDADKHSSETTKEIEFKNYSQSLVLHEKHRIEVNGVAVSDGETSEKILSSITPKRPEKGTISNGGVSHLTAQEQKTLSTLEIDDMTIHDVKIQPFGEAAIDKNGMCKDYVPVIGLKFSEVTFVLEHGKGGHESSLPEVGSPISKHENVDDENQYFLSSDLPEIIHDGEAIQQDGDDQLEHIDEHVVQEHEKCNEPDEEIIPQKGEEERESSQREAIQQDGDDQLEHIDEHVVQEHKKCNEPDEEIIPQKGEEERESSQCEEIIEEKGYIDHPTPEHKQLGDSHKENAQMLAMHLPKEPISSEEMEVAEDAVNGEIEMSFCQHKDAEDGVDDSSETIDTCTATAEDEEDLIDGTDGDEDLSNEAEQNTGAVDTSMESNLGGGGIWPTEAIQELSIETQQEKLVDREIEGKTQEDTTVERGKHKLHSNKIITDNLKIMNGRYNSVKSFIERYAVDLATLKGGSTNSGTRKALLVAIPTLSSVSCSWFFGLSFDKFCFVVLLTIVLSKSMIVK